MVEVDEADIDMNCSKSGCPLEANSTVTVHVAGQFQLITPILGFIFGGQTIDLNTAATQQIEYFPVGGVSTLPPTPVAAFTASDLTGEAPFAVSFDGTSSSGSPTDWVWDFGDGEFAFGNAQVTHVFDDPGTYLVTLRVINLAGDDTSSMSIEITAPSATPTPTPTPGGTPTPTPTPTPTAGGVRLPAKRDRDEPERCGERAVRVDPPSLRRPHEGHEEQDPVPEPGLQQLLDEEPGHHHRPLPAGRVRCVT